MQIPTSTFVSEHFRKFQRAVRRHAKPRRLLRQFLVAMLIAALVLVSLPLAERVTPPAQAQIQVFARTCDPNHFLAPMQIIQGCTLGGIVPEGVVERDVINDLLKVYRLPASDESRLRVWERELIRAAIQDRIITFIQKNPAERTQHEQAVVSALTGLVKARRVLAATKALDEFNRWLGNCPYTPPSAFNNYSESPLCGGGLGGLFGGRTPPSFEQFQAYGAYLANEKLVDPTTQVTMRNAARAYGLLGGVVGAGVAGGVGAAIGATTVAGAAIAKTIFITASGLSTLGSGISSFGAVALAGPAAIIVFAVVVGVIRGIQVFEQEQIPGKLQEAKTQAQNATIDLAKLITTKEGMSETFAEVLQATLPDFPATASVPAIQSSDPIFEFRPASSADFSTSNAIQYKDWDGNRHILRLNGGWFIDQRAEGTEPARLTLDIEFLNAQGQKRQATRSGSRFVISDVSDDNAAPEYVTDLHYRTWQDQPYVARIPDIPPVITVLPVERHQEPPAPTINTTLGGLPTNFNVSHIANISDNDSIEILNVAITSPLTDNGVTLSEFRVDPDGKVFARIQPSCMATDAAFTLQVTDSGNITTTETINVTVTPNTAPVHKQAPAHNVTLGNALTVLPTAGPSDDGGAVNKYASFDLNPLGLGTPTITPINPSAPAFSGTVAHTTSFGNVIYVTPAGLLDIKNAGPLGSYRVDLPMTDSCGLTTVGTFTLNVTCVPIIWGHGFDNPTCPGASNGQLTINANGGSGALKYSKDNGQTFQDSNVFDGLSAGTYKLVVKDASGCATESRSVTLVDPVAVTFTTTPVNPTCNGASNGQITVNASGGTNSFTYSINGGSFGPSNVFTGLAAGSYSIAVKDSNGCAAASQTVTLTQPTALSLTPTGLSAVQAGHAFAQSLTASGGTGTKSISVQGTLPSGVSFTPAANGGTLAGTPLQTGSFPLTFTVTDQNHCSVMQTLTLTVVCPTILLAPTSLPGGTGGVAYQQTLSATPAADTYSFTVSSGSLPPGLALAAGGVLAGTPTLAGNYTFEVTATGFGACPGKRLYQVQIACPALTVNPASLPNGTVGAAYSQTVSATPGGGYSYAVTAGALPSGLSLHSATGALTGTPSQSGTFSFTLTATAFGQCTGSRSYSLTILCPVLTFAPATLPGTSVGAAYNQTVSVSPAGTYSYSVLTGNLPPGLSLNAATGTLSGTVTATGTYSFTLRALGAGGCSTTQAYSLAVSCPAVTLNPASLPSGTVGTAYSQSLSATPVGNYSFMRTSGSLPPGLSLNTAGVLSGTPTTQGSYTFTVQATGAQGCPGSRSYTVIVSASCSTITLPALPNGTVGSNYSGNLAGTTPSSSYSFSLESGALPPGLSLDNLFAALTGKPTAAGTYNFTLKATRSNGCTGTRAYTVVISSGSGSLAKRHDFDGDGKSDLVRRQGDLWQLTLSATGQSEEVHFGEASDLAALGDYDGDGRTDLAVYRAAEGLWLTRWSNTGATSEQTFGAGLGAAWLPVAADYDGDGKTDLALWDSATATWHIQRSLDGKPLTWQFGSPGAVAVPADYDGDGRADLASFERTGARWRIQHSGDGTEVEHLFGSPKDEPLTGDFDGDGRADLGVWRGAEAAVYLTLSAAPQVLHVAVGLTSAADGLLLGDYDGDGKVEWAVWRARAGKWYFATQHEVALPTTQQR
jgi:hypothetical protein